MWRNQKFLYRHHVKFQNSSHDRYEIIRSNQIFPLMRSEIYPVLLQITRFSAEKSFAKKIVCGDKYYIHFCLGPGWRRAWLLRNINPWAMWTCHLNDPNQQLEKLYLKVFLWAFSLLLTLQLKVVLTENGKSWRLFVGSKGKIRIKVTFETLSHKCHPDSHFESNIFRDWQNWKGK